MAGPATNAATITVIGKNLGKKTLIAYLSSLIIGSLVFGLIIDNFLPAGWFAPLSYINGNHAHNLLPYLLTISSTILLTVLLLYNFFNSILQKINKSIKSQTTRASIKIEELVVNVNSMTCVNCKAKVENGISNMPNITSAVADIKNNLVKVYGNNLSANEIGEKVVELGYEYNGILRY